MKIDIQKVLFKNHQNGANEVQVTHNIMQDVSLNNNQIDFNSMLSDVKVASTQSAFHSLLDQLEKQEKALLKNPSVANISAYKRIVKNIVSATVNNFKVEDINLFSNGGYEKIVRCSKVIDEKLESIMKDFLENNKLSLESIDSFADIRGLIVDLIA